MIRRGHSFFQMYGNDFVFSNYIKVQFSIRSSIMIKGLSYGLLLVFLFFNALWFAI